MTLTEFKRFADENNIVPVSTELYSQMISDSVKYAKIKGVLQEIRQEIEQKKIYPVKSDAQNYRNCAFAEALEIIDKYREDGE